MNKQRQDLLIFANLQNRYQRNSLIRYNTQSDRWEKRSGILICQTASNAFFVAWICLVLKMRKVAFVEINSKYVSHNNPDFHSLQRVSLLDGRNSVRAAGNDD